MQVRRQNRVVTQLRSAIAAAFLLLSHPDAATAQNDPATGRLVALGKLWGFVKYHHPALGYRSDLDWDSVLIVTLPRVRQAQTTDEFRASLQDLLGALDDPLTRLVGSDSSGPTGAGSTGNPLAFRVTSDSVLIISVSDYYGLTGPASETVREQIVRALPAARAVVFDVRSAQPIESYGRFQLVTGLAPIERLITSRPLSTPGDRRRVFHGYYNGSAFSSGQYRTGFYTRDGRGVRPAQDARDLPSVTLLNEHAELPAAALAMQAGGHGLIVFQGDPGRAAIGNTRRVSLGENLTAQVRVSEPVHTDGTSARLQPDAVIAGPGPGEADPALDSAVSLARHFRPSTVTRRILPATADAPTERSYGAMEYPPLEYRLLSLFRLWNVINEFYPYKHLLPESWESALPEFTPKFEQARNAVEYSRAVAQMAVRLHDSHAYVAGTVYSGQMIGNGYPPIRVRVVEGQPVVTAFVDSMEGPVGVTIGDIVVAVDGEDAQAWLMRGAALISASTQQGLMAKAALSFMNGPVGSPVRLRLRDRTGKDKEVDLTRRAEDYTTLYHKERTGEIIKLLPGNIGYVDLDRLPFEAVDSMFQRLKQTRAIIFDMRGYPNGTAWAIAPRLTSGQQRAAFFETPIVGADDTEGLPSESFYQTIRPTPPGAWLYTGKTVMLMDERSQSQAEHTGLYLKAANGTTFIGSPTAGADGEITSITLPGTITVGFTGQSVRYPDGRQVQRIGLLPDVAVTPTIKGIREGRDEVLERAIKYLSQKP